MDNTITIRQETKADYERVEKITREAFYNLYIPGCTEHYLVHTMRPHPDFLPELSLVIELDGMVIGSIMYTNARLVDETGNEKSILTFGPLSILPEHQRNGYGKMLLEYSFAKAIALGYEMIVIFGEPGNYVGRGFKSCKKYNVCLADGSFPAAMLVKELKTGALDGKKQIYYQSPVYEFDETAAEQYDDTLEKMEKRILPCQETFYILSHSTIQ